MEVVKTTPPIGPGSTQENGEQHTSGKAYTVTVYAADPDEERISKCLLGHVKIRPGLVAPGQVAAVRTPDGLLRLKRIYYSRAEGGRDFIRLESLEPGEQALRYPLREATVEGAVICVCGIDEECGCAGECPAAGDGRAVEESE